MRTSVIISTLALLLSTGLAVADTHVVELGPVPIQSAITVELGAQFTEIVGVEVHMTGYAGGQRGICYGPGEEYTFELPFEFTVDLGGAQGGFMSTFMEDYDATFALELTDGQADWSFLEDGVAELHIGVDDNYEFDGVWCFGAGYELPTSVLFTVTVTAGAVPVHETTWGAVKALYE